MLGEEELELDKQSVLQQYFEVLRVLGEGSFGQVYLIRNKYSRQQYALKRYKRYQIEKKGRYKMLIRSIYILQHLSHPAVVRFVNYIISPDDSTIYLLFQSAKKGSLEKVMPALRKHYELSRYVLYSLAQALSYLKERNVAHRDIKPSNITFNSQGQLKLIDFDEAVCFDNTFANITQSTMLSDFGINPHDLNLISHKNRASKVVGTQLYMSPEMIHSTIGDQKGDLWALACILYQMFVDEYLHIEFDCPQKFEQELKERLQIFQEVSDDQSYDLFKTITAFDPKERLDIEQVLNHPYFAVFQEPTRLEEARLEMVKFLRGNYGVQPMSALDRCEMEVLELKIGKEIFQELNTAVFVRWGGIFECYQLIGGPRYFKLRNVTYPGDKVYIHYDCVSDIELDSTQITIRGSKIHSKQPRGLLKQIKFKHLYPNMLQRLYDLLQHIIKD